MTVGFVRQFHSNCHSAGRLLDPFQQQPEILLELLAANGHVQVVKRILQGKISIELVDFVEQGLDSNGCGGRSDHNEFDTCRKERESFAEDNRPRQSLSQISSVYPPYIFFLSKHLVLSTPSLVISQFG